MQAPSIPDNETQRLQALRAQAILDTPAEERFDRLTRLAQHMLGAKMALVSLVDADRQWFKSRQGLDACETGRDISFCGHAILDDAIFEITDANLDPRFADNPLVTGPPHIRFYAGAPLATADGCWNSFVARAPLPQGAATAALCGGSKLLTLAKPGNWQCRPEFPVWQTLDLPNPKF